MVLRFPNADCWNIQLLGPAHVHESESATLLCGHLETPSSSQKFPSLIVCLDYEGGVGRSESVLCALLACMLKNFKKGFSGDYGLGSLDPKVLKSL